MSDPLLNEEMIVLLLRATPNDDTIAEVQAGAAQALMDLYDRGVTRAEFGDMAMACLGLYSQTAKLVMMLNIKDAYDRGDVTDEDIKGAIGGLQKLIRKQAETVSDIIRRLQQCPTSQDRVH
jgi:hypothetical protein